MTSKLPTDPLADASTGVVRRSRGASVKHLPKGKPDRRDPSRRKTYTGPERRKEEEPEPAAAGEPGILFGYPRWIVLSAGVYLAALILAMILIFNY
jgi:hypothetical protein